MSNRLALRILSGSLEGETFAIGEGGLSIGRRPTNDLVLEDASVSGAHAALSIEDGELWVRDAGSTNGTRVGGRKVERMSLLSGDEITFGSVRAQIVEAQAEAQVAGEADGSASGSGAGAGAATAPTATSFDDVDEISLEEPDEPVAPSEAPPAAAPAAMPAASVTGASAAPTERAPAASAPAMGGPDADEGVIEADLDAFDRRQKGSKAITVAVVLVVLIGAGVGGWLAFGPGAQGTGDGAGDRADGAAVEPIAGNLLGEDFSFEASEDAATWESWGEAPAALARRRAGAISGRGGLFARLGEAADAELPEGSVDWAARASARASVRIGQVVRARVACEIEGDAWARVGVLLESDSGPLGRGRPRWGRAVSASGVCTAVLPVPLGATGARVVVAAGGDGTVAFDDAALVLVERADDRPPENLGEVGEFDVRATAEGGDVVLARSERAVVVVRAASGGSVADPGHELRVEVVDDAPAIELVLGDAFGAPSDRHLHLELPANDDDAPRHVAVVANGTYRSFGSDFESEGVTQLLLGRGLELVRLRFDEPVAVRGRRDASGALVDVELGSVTRVRAQLAFTSERGAAATLASANRRAREAGRLGDALAGWAELLASYAFQDELVAEAETAIAELTTLGSAQVATLSGAVDRAAFFALPGVYDDCARRARAIVERFTPADGGTNAVRDAALDMLARIESERATLVEDDGAELAPRHEVIRGFLERTGRDALVERFAPGDTRR